MLQGSSYFKFRGRSDFSLRDWEGEVVWYQGEVVGVKKEVKKMSALREGFYKSLLSFCKSIITY